MLVSKTLDYAVRSLTYMAVSPDATFSMKEIAANQHIPLKYLAKIMRKLVNRGLMTSRVGPTGGYTLKVPLSEIRLRDIYETIEGAIDVVDCMDSGQVCFLFESCPQVPVWDKLKVSMIRVLDGITLEEMVQASKVEGSADVLRT